MADLSAEDREALDQVYISHLKKEIERLRAVAQPSKEQITAQVLLAMSDKVGSDTYGVSHALKINKGRAEKAAESILSLLASQPSPAATVETLNEQAREHPRYDNPRDPFASPDRLADRLEQVRNRLTGDDIANICAALRSKPHNGSFRSVRRWLMALFSEMMDEASAMSSEISRLNALLAKIGRSWSSGADEEFGGRFLCIHGLTPEEKDELVDAGLAALSLSSNK